MADYEAVYLNDEHLPVVTHNADGHALVYGPGGRLHVASSIEGFQYVAVARPRVWKISGTFGTGAVAESNEGGSPWV